MDTVIRLRLSPSAVMEYLTCPQRYKLHRVYHLRWEKPPSEGLHLGCAVDDAAKFLLREKLAGAGAPVSTAEDVADCAMRERAEDIDPETNFDGLRQEARALVRTFALSELPRIAPVDVDIRREFELGGETILTFRDWDEQHSNSSRQYAAITDLKVTARAYSPDAPRSSLQLALYHVARLQDEPGGRWSLDFLNLVRRKRGPEILRPTWQPTADIVAWAEGAVRRAAAGIRAGVFAPALGSVWCGESCEFYRTCRADLAERNFA